MEGTMNAINLNAPARDEPLSRIGKLTAANGHASVRRAIVAVVAAAVLAQNAACTPLTWRPDERTCAEEEAEVLSRRSEPANAASAIVFNVVIDGEWRCAAFVPHLQAMSVMVTWSNGWTERAIVFQVMPGRQYSVGAYETGVGRVPAAAVPHLRRRENYCPGLEPLAGEILIPLLAGASWIVPALLVIAVPLVGYEVVKMYECRIGHRPSADCCYVWVADAETGGIIRGTAPFQAWGDFRL
jgi:hypothetical protein